MTSQEYIISSLNSINEKAIASTDSRSMADLIFGVLMSKKFRKYSVNSEYQEHMRSAIALNIQKFEPIKITFVFGGYKLWRLEEAPEVDWGELFSMIYYAQWLRPISACYVPGVWFDFYSDDIIVDRMNNMPRKDVETYIHSFRGLLDFMSSYLPDNMQMTLNRVGDQYASIAEFDAELSALIKTTSVQNLSEAQLATLRLNVRTQPGVEPNWIEIQSLHDAYAQVTKRRPYYRALDKIMAITKQLPNTIAVGTTKTSIAKFWAGAGALKKRKESYVEYVLSPLQLRAATYQWEPVSIPGLAGKNFTNIRVLT